MQKFFFSFFVFAALLQPALAAETEWKPKTEWSGDLRYRLGKSAEASDQERPYQKLRARLGLKADVNDETQAIFRLATGTSATSTNQTLGDSKDPGMARRSFGLDQAYIKWKTNPDLSIWLGRTANPLWSAGKSQIVFDSDLAFEGASILYNPKWNDVDFFFRGTSSVINEAYSAPSDIVDIGLAALQAGASIKSEWGTWTAHVSKIFYLNAQDKAIGNFESGAKKDSYSAPSNRYKGNMIYTDGTTYYLTNRYVLMNVGLEWKGQQLPLEPTLYIETVSNSEASSEGLATEAGAQIRWGRATFSVAYATKQSDSVLATFTDSDMNGGGTDNQGTQTAVKYQLSDRSEMKLTQLTASRGVNSTKRDYNESHLDFIVMF